MPNQQRFYEYADLNIVCGRLVLAKGIAPCFLNTLRQKSRHHSMIFKKSQANKTNHIQNIQNIYETKSN